MRLFITGISGLLGLNVALVARERVEVAGSYFSHAVAADGLEVYAVDARDPDAMTRVLERARPDVVLHTVGLSNVDGCEDDPEHAYQLNVATAREGARLARVYGKASGLIDVAGGERVSKHEYAVRAAEVFGLSADQVRAVPVDSVVLRAPRPRDMSLACRRAEGILGKPMPALREGLLRLRALRERGWPGVLQAAIDDGKR